MTPADTAHKAEWDALVRKLLLPAKYLRPVRGSLAAAKVHAEMFDRVLRVKR